MTLSVTVLGASGTYPAPDTACSGYLLRTATTNVWVDCGSGTLANLQRHIGLGDLDGIVCSHEHPDHWVDLPIALNAIRFGLGLVEARIPLYWTEGTANMFTVVRTRPPEPTLLPTIVDETSRVTIGDLDFRFSRTDHPVETLAMRVEAGARSIVYSADTGSDWDMSVLTGPAGSGIGLALVEATLNESDADQVAHLTGRQAGSQATRAGVARLVLTHLAPGVDPADRIVEAAATFDGPISVATTGEIYAT